MTLLINIHCAELGEWVDVLVACCAQKQKEKKNVFIFCGHNRCYKLDQTAKINFTNVRDRKQYPCQIQQHYSVFCVTIKMHRKQIQDCVSGFDRPEFWHLSLQKVTYICFFIIFFLALQLQGGRWSPSKWQLQSERRGGVKVVCERGLHDIRKTCRDDDMDWDGFIPTMNQLSCTTVEFLYQMNREYFNASLKTFSFLFLTHDINFFTLYAALRVLKVASY